MGQYHLTVNLDRREYLDPYRLGFGLKLAEQVYPTELAHVGDALMVLLAASNGRGGGDLRGTRVMDFDKPVGNTYASSPAYWIVEGKTYLDVDQIIGRWAGERIVVIGDYAAAGDIDEPYSNEPPPEAIYWLCRFEEYQEAAEAWSEDGFVHRFRAASGRELPDTLPQDWLFRDITPNVMPLLEASFGVFYCASEHDRMELIPHAKYKPSMASFWRPLVWPEFVLTHSEARQRLRLDEPVATIPRFRERPARAIEI